MLSQEKAREAVIVALDCSRDDALSLADKLAGRASWVKVGMTLYYACGPSIVEQLRKRGLHVFLDLKLHDIPFQVRGAARAASLVGADLLSVHGLGGSEMVAQARAGVEEAASERGSRTQLVAISVLTSLSREDLVSIGIEFSVEAEVARLATLSVDAGADGVVCSPQEASAMRKSLGPSGLVVTPGIRPTGSAFEDQQRVSTPSHALAAGASKLVIGRPITHAQDPVAAFDAIVQELMRP
ncbi:MAG: orotidine-5'-phosphate decarboxylase [Olegusella sp.]|jgi:orotidine-5'-phosphate decarboxylase|nr:orotidine-5'-phosphate decarboxylase [Olegusella sp.]